MTRPLNPTTSAAFDKADLPLAAILYLDILNDPVLSWTGIGNLTFAAGETGDPSLDGVTFEGSGTVIEISGISDGVGGSDVLEIALPGVDIYQPMLRQLITNRNRWQFRRAVVWMMALDPETMQISGKPFRVKTGRIDQLILNENDKEGVDKAKIEGQQAYGNIPLATRYSEQIDINPNDISQKYVHSLANMTAAIGQASTQPGSGGMNNGGNFGPAFTNRTELY